MSDVAPPAGDAVESRPNYRSGLSLRAHLIGLVIVCILPMVAFAAFSTVRLLHISRSVDRQQMMSTAHALSGAVDLRLNTAIAALDALATSPELASADLGTFYAECRAVAAHHGGAIVLTDGDGRQAFNTSQPLGTPLSVLPSLPELNRAIATGVPQVTDLFTGRTAQRYETAVIVPLRAASGVAHALVMSIAADALSRLLAEQRLPGAWTVSIADRRDVTIARNRDAPALTGSESRPALRQSLRQASEGEVADTSEEGVPVVTDFTHSTLSGWSVQVGVPAADLTTPAWRSLYSILAVGAALLLIGIAIALLIGRRITREMGGLSRMALALGRRDAVRGPRSPIREMNRVATALVRADAHITESEARSRQQLAELEAIYKTAPVGLAVLSPDLAYLRLNQSLAEMNGATVAEHLGKRVQDMVPDLAAKVEALVRLVGQTGQPVFNREIVGETRAQPGVKRVWSESLAPLPDAAGRLAGVNIVIEDVTERRRYEAALAAARDAAEAASRAKSQFLAQMSHEIRTPMNGIMGFSQLIAEQALGPLGSERYVDYARDITASAEHLLRILNDILDLSKLEANGIELVRVDFDLGALVSEAIRLVGPSARERGLPVEAILDPAIDRAFYGDPDRLRQVLMNLVGNAVKFTPSGRITVRVAPQRHDASGEGVSGDRAGHAVSPHDPIKLRFEVQDTGIGIPPEVQSRLFQRFSQADTSISRRFGGTGLGLAISKALITMMAGEIGVESAPGRGSTFWFTVVLTPVVRSGGAIPPTAAAAPRQESHPAKRILAVDDNAAHLDLAAAVLTKAGYEVKAATSGVAALSALAERRYDLILMDIEMPSIDGLETTRRIRARSDETAAIPIVALTARAMPGMREACLAAGMDDYIAKPFEIPVLIAMVARWAGQTHGGGPAL